LVLEKADLKWQKVNYFIAQLLLLKRNTGGAEWAIPGSPLKPMTYYNTILATMQKREGQQRISSNSAEATVVS
jgi:hypothetical protein